MNVEQSANVQANGTNDALVKATTQAQGTPGRQMLTCDRFDGASDRMEFKFWLSQFETLINAGPPMEGKYKLITLRSYLTKGGLAFKLINKLEINNANYDKLLLRC